METYEVVRSAGGTFDVKNSQGEIVIGGLQLRSLAYAEIERRQKQQITEDVFRRAIRREFARIVEDYGVDRQRALQILREETNLIATPAPKKTPMSILREEVYMCGC